MTRSEFATHIAGLSDFDFYTLCRNILLNSLAGSHNLEWKNEALIAESAKRSKDIYAKSGMDAWAIFTYKEMQSSETTVSALLRPELAGLHELETIIARELKTENDRTATSIAGIIGGFANPENLIICKVNGDSMTGANIFDSDILVVDTATQNLTGKVVVASVAGALFVKKLDIISGQLSLVSANEKYPPVRIADIPDYSIIGAVTSVIHPIGENYD